MSDGLQIKRGLNLPLTEVELRTSRSSGPGGQHANVTASRVEAVFEVAASNTLTPPQKARLIARIGERVTAVSQDTRSQAQNRELALERLGKRLAEALAERPVRRPTKPSRAAQRRRLEEKRRRSERKKVRRPPPPED